MVWGGALVAVCGGLMLVLLVWWRFWVVSWRFWVFYKLVPCYRLNSTTGIPYSIIGCD